MKYIGIYDDLSVKEQWHINWCSILNQFINMNEEPLLGNQGIM